MKHTIGHDLTMPLAEKAVARAFETYAAKFAEYHPTVAWSDPQHATIGFKVKGIKLDGKVGLRPGAIDLELDVPFLLKPFQRKAIDVIEAEVREWIEKARSGALLATDPAMTLMPDLIGWAASLTLVLTIGKQVHKQWKEQKTEGVSRWLFVGQLLASVLFLVYSAMVRNWVFVATNAVMLVNGFLGLWMYMIARRRERRTGGAAERRNAVA
jgi:MtN3 and saliva related transmembrane protein